MCPHLAHVAEHQHRRPRARCEHVDRGAHRVRIGVVAVVYHGGAATGLLDLQPPSVGTKRGQALADRLWRHADRVRRGCSGERVAHVVQARDRKGRLRFARRRGDANLGGERVQGVAAGNARRPQAEIDQAPLPRLPSEKRRVGVIRVDHGDTVVAQCSVYAGVLHRDLVYRAHEFQVLALRIVDERHGRAGNAGEISDFPLVVHAELDGAPAMRRPQAQQGQRHADVVVQVSRGRKHGISAGMTAQDRGQHFLHGRLAV